MRFLHLQEKRVLAIISRPQQQCHVATRSYTPHTDDLLSNINQLIPAQQHQSIIWQHCPVSLDELPQSLDKCLVVEMNNQWRFILDAILAIDMFCKLRKYTRTRTAACLRNRLLHIWSIGRSKTSYSFLDINAGVPDLDSAHVTELSHMFPVRLYASQYSLPVAAFREAVAPPGDDNAGGKSFHVPFPWSW